MIIRQVVWQGARDWALKTRSWHRPGNLWLHLLHRPPRSPQPALGVGISLQQGPQRVSQLPGQRRLCWSDRLSPPHWLDPDLVGQNREPHRPRPALWLFFYSDYQLLRFLGRPGRPLFLPLSRPGLHPINSPATTPEVARTRDSSGVSPIKPLAPA